MLGLTKDIVFNYLGNLGLVFFICFVGSLSKDIIDTIKKLNHIEVKKDLISALFCSLGLTAIFEHYKLSIGTCVFVCFFVGIWSFEILKLAMDWQVVRTLLKHFFKNSKNVLSNSLAETIEEMDNDTSKKKQPPADGTQEDDSDKS